MLNTANMDRNGVALSRKFTRRLLSQFTPAPVQVKGYKIIYPPSPNGEIKSCYLCGSKEPLYYKEYCRSCVEDGFILVENPQLIKSKGQERKTLTERQRRLYKRRNEEYWAKFLKKLTTITKKSEGKMNVRKNLTDVTKGIAEPVQNIEVPNLEGMSREQIKTYGYFNLIFGTFDETIRETGDGTTAIAKAEKLYRKLCQKFPEDRKEIDIAGKMVENSVANIIRLVIQKAEIEAQQQTSAQPESPQDDDVEKMVEALVVEENAIIEEEARREPFATLATDESEEE